MGRGGGEVVSVHVFYSDNPRLSPVKAYNFYVKMVVFRYENKQKEAGVGPFVKKQTKRFQVERKKCVTNDPEINSENCEGLARVRPVW